MRYTHWDYASNILTVNICAYEQVNWNVHTHILIWIWEENNNFRRQSPTNVLFFHGEMWELLLHSLMATKHVRTEQRRASLSAFYSYTEKLFPQIAEKMNGPARRRAERRRKWGKTPLKKMEKKKNFKKTDRERISTWPTFSLFSIINFDLLLFYCIHRVSIRPPKIHAKYHITYVFGLHIVVTEAVIIIAPPLL